MNKPVLQISTALQAKIDSIAREAKTKTLVKLHAGTLCKSALSVAEGFVRCFFHHPWK